MSIRMARFVQCHALPVQDVAPCTAFNDLASIARIQTSLTLQRSAQASLGLSASARHARGDILMRVPRSAAIVLDYDRGVTLPPARWPRLRGTVAPMEPLPWDILHALALLDGLAGDGGEFWQRYCDVLLPAPERLTLPMCWEPHRLAQLQHVEIAAAATAQQDRLTGLFPELMEPLGPDVPSWMQWAFACVRSRAFRAGPNAFAFVPFLDLANHAEAPTSDPSPSKASAAAPSANADFRASPVSSGGLMEVSSSYGSGSGSGEFFELVALRDIAPDEEVTISYSGPEGYTNQRYMAQYGFVPSGGNLADRVQLELGPELQAAPINLARLQDLLGDALFLGALKGTDKYLFAAIKSLPLVDGDQAQADPRVGSVPGGASGVAGGDASVRTAQALLRQVEAQIAECATTLGADEDLLDSPMGQELWISDPRQAAAVSYRVERKRLLAKTAALMRAYTRGSAR